MTPALNHSSNRREDSVKNFSPWYTTPRNNAKAIRASENLTDTTCAQGTPCPAGAFEISMYVSAVAYDKRADARVPSAVPRGNRDRDSRVNISRGGPKIQDDEYI